MKNEENPKLPDGPVKYDLAEEIEWRDALEPCARAIAARKRGVSFSDPEIDAVWPSYQGQAESCILTFFQVWGAQMLEKEYGCQFIGMGDGLFMPQTGVDRLLEQVEAFEAGERGTGITGMSKDELLAQLSRRSPEV